MTKYICELCKYETSKKSNLDRHNNTKKHHENCNKRVITDFTNVNSNTDLTQDNIGEVSFSIPTSIPTSIPEVSFSIPNTNLNVINYFKCEYCNKEFTKKNNLYRHIKHICKKAKELNNTNNTFTCNSCDKVFNNHSSYYRHKKHFCKHKLEEDNIINSNFKNKLIPFSQNSHNNTNTNTNHSHSHNSTVNNVGQINNNITIKNFGAEDTSHLTDEFMYEMIRAPQKMMLPMIEKIHLDENKPENKNIKVPNIRENTYKVYDQGKWLYKDRDEIIKDMVDAKCYEVDRFYTDKIENNKTDFEKNITKYHKTKYVEFQSKYDTEDKDIINGLFKDCKLALISLRKELNKD